MGRIAKEHVWQGILSLLAICWLALFGSTLCACSAVGQRSHYSANRIIVTLAQGKTDKNLAKLLSGTGGRIVRRIPFANAYTIELPGGGRPAERFMSAKSRHLRANPAVKAAQYNYTYYLHDIPNDPFFAAATDIAHPNFLSGQWHLQPGLGDYAANHIYAPGAWDLGKGSNQVVVAVLDTGIRDRLSSVGGSVKTPHPDLVGRLLPDGTKIGGITTDPSPSDSSMEDGHGTHVAGIIAAQGNNSIGISGVCWNNVWILPVNVFPTGAVNGTSDDIVAEAIYQCIDYRNTTQFPGSDPLKVNVINMSLGGADRSDILQQAVQAAAKAGIVIVASSGNDYANGVQGVAYPAAYSEVIAVGATNYSDQVTDFSQRGSQLSLVAPGYNVLSTFYSGAGWDSSYPVAYGRLQGTLDSNGNGYAYLTGTSMAAPVVSGAAALLMSNGVPASDVRGILQETASAVTGEVGRPNDNCGWGIVNLQAALLKSFINVEIGAPGKSSIVGDTRPTIRVDFRHAKLGTIRIKIDGVLAIGPQAENPSMGYLSAESAQSSDPQNLYTSDFHHIDIDAGTSYVEFIPSAPLSIGLHQIEASADSDLTPLVSSAQTPAAVDDTQFEVTPTVLSRGWHLFSVPYKLVSGDAASAFTDVSGFLARWNYATSASGSYAMYSLDKGIGDLEASFRPPSVANGKLAYSTSNPIETASPSGLGYWLYVGNVDGVPVPEVVGTNVDSAPYVVSLFAGWNMIGCPFTYPVDWAGVEVEYNGNRVSAAQAVQNGWISGSIYRFTYDGSDTVGHYETESIQSGSMIPWEAQWVKVLVKSPSGWPAPDVNLIIPSN